MAFKSRIREKNALPFLTLDFKEVFIVVLNYCLHTLFKKNFVYCDTSTKWRAVTFGQEEKNEEEEKTLLSGKNERQQNYLKDPYIGLNHLGFFLARS